MLKKKLSQPNYEHCCLCNSMDNQVILILDALLENMQKTAKTQNKITADLQNTNIQFVDFSRLIKMIFGRRFKNLKSTITCSHDSLKNHFMRKIQCSERQIDNLSHSLSWKIAKYNFHTDVIISQSKSFLRHLTNLQTQKQSSSLSFSSVRSQPLGITQKRDQKNREPIQQYRYEFDYDHIQQEQDQNQHFNVQQENNDGMMFMGTHNQQMQPQIFCVLPISWSNPQHFMFPTMQDVNNQNIIQKQKEREKEMQRSRQNARELQKQKQKQQQN